METFSFNVDIIIEAEDLQKAYSKLARLFAESNLHISWGSKEAFNEAGAVPQDEFKKAIFKHYTEI